MLQEILTLGKIFSASIWRLWHAKNFKNIYQMKEKSNKFNSLIYFCFLRMPLPPKSMPNKIIITFHPIFATIKLKRVLFFIFENKIWVQYGYLIHLTYHIFILVKNIFFNFLKILEFLIILRNISNSWIFWQLRLFIQQ